MDDELIWLNEYINKEKEFNIFYNDKVSFFNAIFIYIKKNEIIQIKKEKINLDDVCFEKDKLNNLINKYKKNNKLAKILKYNFNVKENEIKNYVKNEKNTKIMKFYDKIEDIYWEKTIPLFSSLNSLYFIFVNNKSKTKKIKIFNKNKTRKHKFSNTDLKISKSIYDKIENKLYI